MRQKRKDRKEAELLAEIKKDAERRLEEDLRRWVVGRKIYGYVGSHSYTVTVESVTLPSPAVNFDQIHFDPV